jgi:hypothetical protein
MEASAHARAYFEAVGEIAAAIDVRHVDAMPRAWRPCANAGVACLSSAWAAAQAIPDTR